MTELTQVDTTGCLENFTHVAKTGQNAGVWTQVFCSILHKNGCLQRVGPPGIFDTGSGLSANHGGWWPKGRSPPPRLFSSGSSALSGNRSRSRLARDIRPQYTGWGVATSAMLPLHNQCIRPFLHFRACGYRRAAAYSVNLQPRPRSSASSSSAIMCFTLGRTLPSVQRHAVWR